jgi:aryl-alcohol dehydrogenase-like predicted oxidoreductase
VARLDLMYAHIEDPSVPVEETVGAFGELVASGEVGLLRGAWPRWTWS